MMQGDQPRNPRRVSVPDPRRVRRIERGFSWIDRRFVREFARALARDEILLYFFLVAVANRDGVSFYADATIAALLKLDLAAIEAARRGLLGADLVAFRAPVYQVLALPMREASRPSNTPMSLAEILRQARSEGDR
jgi:hypothetical protein